MVLTVGSQTLPIPDGTTLVFTYADATSTQCVRVSYTDASGTHTMNIVPGQTLDALTSNRPYRNPMQPSEGVEYVMANVGIAFDYDVVMAFIKKLALYPVGALVELSNRKIGCVVDNEHAMRPIVRLTDTGDILDLYLDFSCLNLTIRRVIAEDEILRVVG